MSNFDINNFEQRLAAKNKFDGQLVFGASKFHHDTQRTGKDKPASGGFKNDLARAVDDTGKERYQRKAGMWEPVDQCPVCQSTDRDFFLYRHGMEIYRCLNCTHGYLNPRIVYDKAMELYTNDQNSYNIYSSSTQIELDKVMCKYALDLIAQLNPPGQDKIMDLGCGSGTMLKIAHENGWQQCIGVDINPNYGGIYQDIPGVQFINSTVENMDISKLGTGYDCVTMWEFIEHIYDLQAVLKSIKTLLKKDGLLFVKLPNFLSLATRLMREMSPTFSWKHVSYFTFDSLNYLMEHNGFKPVFTETIISEIDNIKSYMSGEYPYHGYGDPENLFDFITPEYLHKNNLGSRIVGVYRSA